MSFFSVVTICVDFWPLLEKDLTTGLRRSLLPHEIRSFR